MIEELTPFAVDKSRKRHPASTHPDKRYASVIIGLPGETEADTRESLDLLHAMKGSKWVVVPTLFTPLEDTRLGSKQAAKLPQLTELQWEFFFTCWRYNLDLFHHNRSWLKIYLRTPIYYYLLGRKMFGDRIKYPLWRLAHVPEPILRHRLYLDLDAPATKFKVPQGIPQFLPLPPATLLKFLSPPTIDAAALRGNCPPFGTPVCPR